MKTSEEYKDDFDKIKGIVDVLSENEEVMWLSKISKEAKIAKSTVKRLLDGKMAFWIENSGVTDEEGNYMFVRMISLKPEYRDISKKDIKKLLDVDRVIKTV